ncbi:osmoprotectant transport system substrate-binding protein [Rhodococcus sp. LBL1]|nr:osmoprotectant transport system substrate-binding protein [Rhodococcus sp. LBL1]MDH6681234.1 osmoprotectant transport system substrate-binding protein [Rhodococcus sp. LBL2]
MSNRNGRAGRLAVLTVVPVLAIVAACGVDTSSSVSGPPAPGPVVVGASNTIESELVARLYAGALEAGGRSAELVLGLGDRADRIAALDSNRVTLVPDYTGRLLHWFDPDADATESEDVFEALNKSLPEGLTVSDYAPADDRSALVLSAAQADRLGAHSIDDIAPDCGGMTLYASAGFRDDARAPEHLQAAYGCTFGSVVPVETTTDVARELIVGTSPIGGATAASPDVAHDELVVLADNEYAFTAQNVVPLYRSGVLRADDVKGLSVVLQLTTADLTDMVIRIRGGEITSADAAAEWLADHL